MGKSSNSSSIRILAILCIAIGIIGILNQVFHINIIGRIQFWPIFVLVPGLAFEWSYFAERKSPGLLVPGGILVTIGLLFFFETFTGWRFAAYTWPVYVLAPAIGLFQLYLYGGHERGLLIPVGILTIISVVSFASMFLGGIFRFINKSLIWPVALVLVGVALLVGRDEKHKRF